MLILKRVTFFDRELVALSSLQGLLFFGDEANLQPLLTKYQWTYLEEGTTEGLEALMRFLAAYENGTSELPNVPLDAQLGTTFQKNVWAALAEIPYGEVTTYQKIAANINHPKALQAVGTAIGKNPWLVLIPCHRVLPKKGGLGGFSSGVSLKQKLLASETGKDNQI